MKPKISSPSLPPDLITTIRACLDSVIAALPPSTSAPLDASFVPAHDLSSRPVLVMHPYRRATDQEPPPNRRRYPSVPAPKVSTTPKTPAAPPRSRRVAYRPRVVYHATAKAVPVRSPLPETDAAVYQAIRKAPGTTARAIQTTLKLRDGQLWGAIRRLTIGRLIRTTSPR